MGEKLYGQTKTIQEISIPSIFQNKKIADSLFNLGEKYQDSGNFKRALPLFENSLKIYQNIGANKNIGDCFSDIGILYSLRNRLWKNQM